MKRITALLLILILLLCGCGQTKSQPSAAETQSTSESESTAEESQANKTVSLERPKTDGYRTWQEKSAVINNTTFTFYVLYKKTSDDRIFRNYVYAYDENGNTLEKHTLSGNSKSWIRSYYVDDDTFYINYGSDNEYTVYAFSEDGSQKWEYASDKHLNFLTADNNHNIMLKETDGENPYIVKLNSQSKPLGKFYLNSKYVVTPSYIVTFNEDDTTVNYYDTNFNLISTFVYGNRFNGYSIRDLYGYENKGTVYIEVITSYTKNHQSYIETFRERYFVVIDNNAHIEYFDSPVGGVYSVQFDDNNVIILGENKDSYDFFTLCIMKRNFDIKKSVDIYHDCKKVDITDEGYTVYYGKASKFKLYYDKDLNLLASYTPMDGYVEADSAQ